MLAKSYDLMYVGASVAARACPLAGAWAPAVVWLRDNGLENGAEGGGLRR